VAAVAQAAEPLPFDYHCGPDVATAARPPEQGWTHVDDGTLPRDPTAQHCWLRVDLTPLGSKVLRVTGAGSQTEITVYAADGRVLASMRERRDRDQAIVGSRGVLFPTLRPELGRLDLRVYRRTSPLRVEAADLVESVQAERNIDFATVATGALWSVLALAALVLGFVNRDRAQFVLSAALGGWRSAPGRISAARSIRVSQRRGGRATSGSLVFSSSGYWQQPKCCGCASARRAGTSPCWLSRHCSSHLFCST
jgi:hypothetical protein